MAVGYYVKVPGLHWLFKQDLLPLIGIMWKRFLATGTQVWKPASLLFFFFAATSFQQSYKSQTELT